MTRKPRIAITVGDPAGIGPEIARKAADDARVREACETSSTGRPRRRPSSRACCPPMPGRPRTTQFVTPCATHRPARSTPSPPLRSTSWPLRVRVCRGRATPICLAISPAPTRQAMMFWSEPLKVVLASVHVPLRRSSIVTRELLDSVIDLTNRELPRLWRSQPRGAARGPESSCGRGRADGRRRTARAEPGGRGRSCARRRLSTGRFPAIQCSCARPRRVRRRHRLLPRPGTDSREAAGLWPRLSM